MPFVNPDGSLSNWASSMLSTLDIPLTGEQIAQKTEYPLFRVRRFLHQMLTAEFVEQKDDKYIITDKGRNAL
jgi:DNA-binding IclR family transcriptional regulator